MADTSRLIAKTEGDLKRETYVASAFALHNIYYHTCILEGTAGLSRSPCTSETD